VIVSATERRRAGGRVCAAVAVTGCDCAGGLVDWWPGPPVGGGSTWALAGLGIVVIVEEGPAIGEGEVVPVAVDARAAGSFAGTLSTSDVCGCRVEAAPAIDVEVWGGV
jgi:hypothetical protein